MVLKDGVVCPDPNPRFPISDLTREDANSVLKALDDRGKELSCTLERVRTSAYRLIVSFEGLTADEITGVIGTIQQAAPDAKCRFEREFLTVN